MKCRELQTNLSLYFDDVLTPEERDLLDGHLAACPLCRQTLSDLQDLRNGLRALARPKMPEFSVASLRAAVAEQLRPSFATPGFHLLDQPRNWSKVWMMPSAVGAFASVVIFTFMLWGILFTAPDPGQYASATRQSSTPLTFPGVGNRASFDNLDISPSEYALTRHNIAGESPSLNPQGALVALTKSLVRGEMSDEEVVVVADVFSNGLAQIQEVVEPTNDARAIERLEKALQSDPSYAPFVPASFDQRSETMRVVLKIQSVEVYTSAKSPRRRSVPDRRRL
jgi:hypothetical protein